MATTGFNSSLSKVTAKIQSGGTSRSSASYTQLTFSIRQPIQKTIFHKSPSELLFAPSKHTKICLATDSDQAAAAASETTQDTSNAENSPNELQLGGNGSPTPEAKEPAVTSKRPPLTAREKLRAARVLSKYTESKPSKNSKPEFGSKVLDALREADKGKKKKRSGLPEAPMNLFDDSKRGMPKDGWTFDLPVGNDVLVIAVSFVLITTIMFGTTYLVWKLGAIHFNEY